MDSARPDVRAQINRLLKAWGWILLLGAIEFSLALLPIPHAFRPLIMLPGLAMIAGVALFFMEVNRGPAIVRAFAVAALFWLFVLLALGSCDPFTRTEYKVPPPNLERAADTSKRQNQARPLSRSAVIIARNPPAQ
jgi:hypothetical protein